MSTKVKVREAFENPPPIVLNLEGIDDPSVDGHRVVLNLEAAKPKASSPSAYASYQSSSSRSSQPGRVSGCVLFQPIHLNGLILAAKGAYEGAPLGVELDGEVWYSVTRLKRVDGRGWVVENPVMVNEGGQLADPVACLPVLWKALFRAAEMVRESHLPLFVLAERAQTSNFIRSFELDCSLARVKSGSKQQLKDAEEARKRMAKVRFSGMVGEARKNLEEVEKYLIKPDIKEWLNPWMLGD